jgi:hypothetical protein
MVSSGVAYATHYLDSLDMRPARRIELARMFSIHDWVRPAVTTLLRMEMADLSDVDQQQLGPRVYSVLAKAREKLERERKLVAAMPPPMKVAESWECRSHEQCKAVWKEVWWRVIAKEILHPTRPLPFSEAPDLIARTEFKGMTLSCKQDIIGEVQANGFQGEAGILAGVIDAVVRHHRSLSME